MQPPPHPGAAQPRRFRLHWPTAVVLTVVAGGILWLNVRPTQLEERLMMRSLPPDELDPLTYRLFYRGWPLPPFMFCGERGMEWDPHNGGSQAALLFDAFFAVGVLAGVGCACEGLIVRLKASGGCSP